mmetsp:Transcript_80916/g.225185  ORF Transcript_80916/g.225185 Transcript_80916/m.225185 type:complete len:425 (-) Transcript_80916:1133-2407(-)
MQPFGLAQSPQSSSSSPSPPPSPGSWPSPASSSSSSAMPTSSSSAMPSSSSTPSSSTSPSAINSASSSSSSSSSAWSMTSPSSSRSMLSLASVGADSRTSGFSCRMALSNFCCPASDLGGGARGGSPSFASNWRSTAPIRMASKGGSSSALLSTSQSKMISSAVRTCLLNARSSVARSSPPRRRRHNAMLKGLAGDADEPHKCSRAVSVSSSMSLSPSSFWRWTCKSVSVLTFKVLSSSKQAIVAASIAAPGVCTTSLALRSSRYMSEPVPWRKNFGSCATCSSTARVRSASGKAAWPPRRTQREVRWTRSECRMGTSTSTTRRTFLNWIPSPACEVSASMTRNRSPRRLRFASLKSLSSSSVATRKPAFRPVLRSTSSMVLKPISLASSRTTFSFDLAIDLAMACILGAWPFMSASNISRFVP